MMVKGRNEEQTLAMAKKRQAAVFRDLSYDVNREILSKVKLLKDDGGEPAQEKKRRDKLMQQKISNAIKQNKLSVYL